MTERSSSAADWYRRRERYEATVAWIGFLSALVLFLTVAGLV